MRLVVLHAGGLGDLVLVETFFSALRERHPGARVELVCRADVAPVASLYAQPPDAVVEFDFDPYRWALPDDRAALQARTLLRRIDRSHVDLFVSAELRSTWLSEILAAALDPADAVIADECKPRSSDVLILLGRLGLDRNRAVRRPPAIETEHELDRYARLAGAAGRRLPALRPPEVPASNELVVFPLASSHINRWPLRTMGEAAVRVAAARGATIVLIVGERDGAELKAAVAAGSFGRKPKIVIGMPADLPAVAARIAAAAGYLGIETGLVHLAAAYGLPGAAVYGGGYWPVYGPWAARSAAVVAPIPCFGCQWDCAFERAFCLEAIDADSVVAAFDAAFAGATDGPVIHALDAYGARERTIFEAAASVHGIAQQDRAARLTEVTRLRDVLARYAARTRARSRRATTALASLAEATTHAAQRLEAGTSKHRFRITGRASSEEQ
jgi:ADP-heptose:LPS heptosyltransferase